MSPNLAAPTKTKKNMTPNNANSVITINTWKNNLYHFNLDPLHHHPGGQVIQVACVGSINFEVDIESDVCFLIRPTHSLHSLCNSFTFPCI